MGQKNQKGNVSITEDNRRIRLRWRYQNKRYSINLSSYNKTNLLQAKKIALQIEQDMVTDNYDHTLVRYSGSNSLSAIKVKSVVQLFEDWVIQYKQMDCEKHTNYNSTRNMMKKWGKIDQGNILKKLNAETFCGATYNRRLAILKQFSNWLTLSEIWGFNPLNEVSTKKYKKPKLPKRAPLTITEIQKILDAVKNDTFCSKHATCKHSHYYPFLYFMFKTGVRNAEAIGLRVSNIDIKNKRIHITEVLARKLNCSGSVNRIRKETKNGKVRVLPLTEDLLEVLQHVLIGKKLDDLVFQSFTKKSIDDHNFQKRVFKPVLKELGISERVLYSARHTFGSRCIDAGITPVMTAFLMGNNPETALKRYTHQLTIPDSLPSI